MANDEGGPKKPHLSIVARNTDRQLAIRKALDRMAMGEFFSGTFEKALERRDDFFDRELRIEGVSDREVKAKIAKEKILESLFEEGRVIDTEMLPVEELTRIVRHIVINKGMKDWLAETGMTLKDSPNLPWQNIKKYVAEFHTLVHHSAGGVSHRERVERHLQEQGIEISNQDVTRLLLYELNKDRMTPQVLILPNDYKPYNPFLVRLVGETKLPPTVNRFLNCFNR